MRTRQPESVEKPETRTSFAPYFFMFELAHIVWLQLPSTYENPMNMTKKRQLKRKERDGENAISTYVFQGSVLVRINRNQIVVQKHQCQRAKVSACNRGAPVKEQSYTVWRAQLGHRLYFEVHRYFASLLRFDFEI